ncbi:hypothetical protein CJ030_MR8G001582 [Morella rubra]|uniref:Uncharacterized protein n=1 Tax=Morella rubra TaxID=262757 RepID=A0A6A1UWM5_9ROSI|nr:hypothetical protein CJ030_MR8G001582 [Morella rubra]
MAALAVKASVALQNSSKNDGHRRKKNRISPVIVVNQSVSFESTEINIQYDSINDRFGAGYGPKGQRKTPVVDTKKGGQLPRVGSIGKSTRYTSKRTKVVVRSFRHRLSTIYEGTPV